MYIYTDSKLRTHFASSQGKVARVNAWWLPAAPRATGTTRGLGGQTNTGGGRRGRGGGLSTDQVIPEPYRGIFRLPRFPRSIILRRCGPPGGILR